MPIPSTEINTDWVTLPATATVRVVRDTIPPDERRKRWIVVDLGNNSFAVFRLGDLIAFLQKQAQGADAEAWMFTRTLGDLNFLSSFARAAVTVTDDWNQVKTTWNAFSDLPLVVLNNGVAMGVLKSAVRGSGGDVGWLDHEPQGTDGGQHAIPPMSVEPPPPTAAPPAPQPGTLDAVPGDVIAPPARKINARLEDHDAAAPLQVGETYTLAFSVDLDALPDAVGSMSVDENRIFPEGVDQVTLTVQLLSDDFDVLSDPQKLIVPRQGASKNKARFDISAKHNGASEITAVFSKDGNAVQAMTLKLNVGLAGQPGVLGTQSLGRPVDAAGAVKPRQVSLWIEYTGSSFRVNVIGSGAISATLPVTTQELERAVLAARQALEDIVNFTDSGNLVYQTGIDVSAAVSQKTLPQLAQAGYLLFQTIFLHPGVDQQGRALAQFLRDAAQKDTLQIQIVSKEMMLPWGMLYMANQFDPNNINPELFLGLKHIIEHVPFQPNMDFPQNITSQPQLNVSLNLNTEIDQDMGFPLIANQVKYWNTVASKGGVKITQRTTANDVINALADASTPDQITYLYCHAVSRGLDEKITQANGTVVEKDPLDSMFQFGKNQFVTLRDLNLRAPSDTRLPSAPLVFVNACESAELSPLFYNGFMPYFVDKGARGLIGTECPMPALLAADWMQKFFDQFLAGKALGRTFLDLRRDYFYNHNNILGLLYAVYCDADTQITPAVAM